ncbi:TerD family protein [Curtobacterium sp. MCBD17_040]|uniref:TerD family protein n=1 Tax=Curtobacterium sp. MCBD17_040 TaxID=2175674 RepID=UPI0015E8A3D7|nr:TerD family protein [Curtobacterium sp. MCBD17_040]WIB65398.1 TerD family protein [Curtobacterium sp. MCBD17_040]
MPVYSLFGSHPHPTPQHQENPVTISLEKNKPISLTKADPGIKRAVVGLGWKPRATSGAEFDLDASAIVLRNDGSKHTLRDFVFYGNQSHSSGAINHQGDNRTGNGDGDDEQILIDLAKLPENIARIVFIVSINDAEKRNQRFGLVDDAYFRIVNVDTKEEAVKFDLREDAAAEHTIAIGELYKDNGAWQVVGRAQGLQDGLAGALTHYGVDPSDV